MIIRNQNICTNVYRAADDEALFTEREKKEKRAQEPDEFIAKLALGFNTVEELFENEDNKETSNEIGWFKNTTQIEAHDTIVMNAMDSLPNEGKHFNPNAVRPMGREKILNEGGSSWVVWFYAMLVSMLGWNKPTKPAERPEKPTLILPAATPQQVGEYIALSRQKTPLQKKADEITATMATAGIAVSHSDIAQYMSATAKSGGMEVSSDDIEDAITSSGQTGVFDYMHLAYERAWKTAEDWTSQRIGKDHESFEAVVHTLVRSWEKILKEDPSAPLMIPSRVVWLVVRLTSEDSIPLSFADTVPIPVDADFKSAINEIQNRGFDRRRTTMMKPLARPVV